MNRVSSAKRSRIYVSRSGEGNGKGGVLVHDKDFMVGATAAEAVLMACRSGSAGVLRD